MQSRLLAGAFSIVALTHAACGSSEGEDETAARRARPDAAAGAAGAAGIAGTGGSATAGAAGSPDVTGFGGSVSSGGGTGGAGTSAGGASTSMGGATSSAGAAGSAAGGPAAGNGGAGGQTTGPCGGSLACTAAVPTGFAATAPPVAATSAPVCAGGERLGTVAGGPLQCAACACTGVAATCTATDIRLFTGAEAASCGGAGQPIDPQGPSCGEYSVSAGSNAHARFTLTLPPVSCTSGGGNEMARPPGVASAIDLCPANVTVGGCAGALCADPNAPLCIVGDGDVACPAGWSKTRTLGFRGQTDTRGCAACGCDAQGSCPSSTIAVLQQPGCNGDFGPFFRFASDTCASLPLPSSGTKPQHMLPDPSPATVVCSTKGGGAVGSVQLTQPATVCCR